MPKRPTATTMPPPPHVRWYTGADGTDRPRWEPSPRMKKLSPPWTKVHYFKDRATGRWMDRPSVWLEAEIITRDVNACIDEGGPITDAIAHIAPEGLRASLDARPAKKKPPTLRSRSAGERSIGVLHDDYFEDPKPFKKVLSDVTRKNYRQALGKLLQTLAANSKISLDELRSLDITFLARPPEGQGGRFYLSDAYDALHARTPSQAAASMAVASAWLDWVRRKRNLLRDENPCSMVVRALQDDDVAIASKVYDEREREALIWAAEWLDLHSIADMIILGIDLTWSPQTLIPLQWQQFIAMSGDRIYVKGRRRKTGQSGAPRLMPEGRARLALIRQRWLAAGGAPEQLHGDANVFLCEVARGRTTCPDHGLKTCMVCFGREWNQEVLRDHWRLVREVASSAAWEIRGDEIVPATPGLPRADTGARWSYPEILDKKFMHLRHTGITEAGEVLEDDEVQLFSLHKKGSRVTNQHYRDFNQAKVDRAADKREAHILAKRSGKRSETAELRRKLRLVKG